MHIVYQVTPTFISLEPNWQSFLHIYNTRLNERQKQIAEVIGVSEWFLIQANNQRSSVEKSSQLPIHKRFFTALMLNDLVHEVDFKTVMLKYNVNRGSIQNLQSLSSTFAGMVTIFCEKLSWDSMQSLLHQFKDRLNFGVHKELIELVRIPNVKRVTARILWKAGFFTVGSVASATVDEILQVISRSRPFKTSKGEPLDVHKLEYRSSHGIIAAAKLILANDRKELERVARNLGGVESNQTKIIRKRASLSAKSINESNKRHSSSTPANRPEKPQYLKTPGSSVQNEINSGDVFQIMYLLDDESFTAFISEWSKQNEYVWNNHVLEHDGVKQLAGIAVAWNSSLVYFIDFISHPTRISDVKHVLLNDSAKICFDSLEQISLLYRSGFTNIGFTVIDPMVACWILDPEKPKQSLQQMMKAYLPQSSFNLFGSLAEITCRESIQVIKLMSILQNKLRMENLLSHFFHVESAMIHVISEMENVGVGFDASLFLMYWDFFTKTLYDIEQHVYKLAGKTFSITSPQQVSAILFDDLKIPYPQENLGKTNKKSTKSEVLIKIQQQHPIVSSVMEFRTVSTIVSNHLFPLMHVKKYNHDLEMNRVHSRYDYHTATGRVTTQRPNLQNVPHAKRELQPNEDLSLNTISLRDSFVAIPGNILISADYCQLELRLIAYLSNEETLLNIFASNEDPFSLIASEWFQVPLVGIPEDLRKKAKTVIYAVIYGIGPHSLSEDLTISIDEANLLIKQVRQMYPMINEYQKRVVKECSQKGYVVTILGRKRYLPKIHSTSIPTRLHAERQTLNTIIQGSAADIVKLAMIRLSKEINSRYKKVSIKLRPNMILQVHDELIFV